MNAHKECAIEAWYEGGASAGGDPYSVYRQLNVHVYQHL